MSRIFIFICLLNHNASYPCTHCLFNCRGKCRHLRLMKKGSVPLSKLSIALFGHCSSITLTKNCNEVVSSLFDAYTNNTVTPDHLLTGISECIIETCFLKIKGSVTKTKYDMFLCNELLKLVLHEQGAFFN